MFGVQASINSLPAWLTNTGMAYPEGSFEDDQTLTCIWIKCYIATT